MVLRKTPLYLLLLFIGFASCKKANIVPKSLKGKNLVLTSFDQLKVTADNAFTFLSNYPIKPFKRLQ
jgi:hypothetical protein